MKKLYILILLSFSSPLYASDSSLPSHVPNQNFQQDSSSQQKLEQLLQRLRDPKIQEMIKNFDPGLPKVKRRGFSNLSERIQEIDKLNGQYIFMRNKALPLYKLAEEYQIYVDAYIDLIGKAKESLGKDATVEQLSIYFEKNFKLEYHLVSKFIIDAGKIIYPLEELDRNFKANSEGLESNWIDYPHSGVHPNLPIDEFIKYSGIKEGSDHCRINRLEKKKGKYLKISVTLGKNTESILIPIQQFKWITPPVKGFSSDENQLYEIRFYEKDPINSTGSFYLDQNGQLDSIQINKPKKSSAAVAFSDFFNFFNKENKKVIRSSDEIRCKLKKDITGSHQDINSNSLTRNTKIDQKQNDDQNLVEDLKGKKK